MPNIIDIFPPTILDDSISNSKLGVEFTESQAMTTDNVDFSTAAVFTKTITGDSTFTFSNVSTGMVKTLVVSGDHSLTLPTYVKVINGEYSGSATSNFIQLISTNDSTEVFATISNYTV
jgi:hypothetical protein